MKDDNKDTVISHDEIRHLVDIIHYDEHPPRTESALFRKNKKELHDAINEGKIPACFINNGCCSGQTEIHHYLVEYAAGTEVDWAQVNSVYQSFGQANLSISTPDEMANLLPLCHKHHMGVGTGIHMVSFPAWILQKFLNEENLALFEAAITHLKEEKHPNHNDPAHEDHLQVNQKADKILKKLAST